MSIKNIMVATDFSDLSDNAIRLGEYLGEKFNAGLFITHIVKNLDDTYSIIVEREEFESLKRSVSSDIEDQLKRIVKDVDSWKKLVKEGEPCDEIIKLSKENNIDLVVAGLWGKGHGRKFKTAGTVIKRILQKSHLDIVAVHPETKPPVKNIGVGVDLSEISFTALKKAISLAERLKIDRIEVVHAFELPLGYYKIGLSHKEATDRLVSHIEEKFNSKIEEIGKDRVELKLNILEGETTEVINRFVKDKNIDILFIGARGSSKSATVLLGNVVEKILYSANTTVWIVKSHEHNIGFWRAIGKLMGLIPE